MIYQLVTTKNGQFPLSEIEEGTEVLSHGEWKIAPKPVRGICIKCHFSSLPSTSFEKKFLYKKRELYCNHQPILNKFECDKPGLSVRGYLHEIRKNDSKAINMESSQLSYWYPRVIDFLGKVVFPNISQSRDCFTVYESYPKLEELSGNELSERNLEYYLEGMLRKKMLWLYNSFISLSSTLDESDKMVLRLLDIDVLKNNKGFYASNPVQLLNHIKDDYNKNRLTEDMVRILLTKSYELPQYTPGYKIENREECEDWMLPNINPDINCLSPYEWEYFDKDYNPQVKKYIKTVEFDSLGKHYKNQYKKNNLWEKFVLNENFALK